ncbi:2-C-methyl-D-erythritol 2,4-cyclodiphosphate synthase [Spiroplasma diminutum]|uniref:2-C-methyl-D-erythritol 2,4-cyclodiphosphate synthase n=1 Tax=Spiroplasma diminutum CUAS-1 TaxID=1276221 RepID=S5LXJ5_9MOLU|nr:2-C-methyl-D-erythritol 2,4-cyclodiphosphate synthase [Spiroplasma diminutum]AGR42529.1 2-C-methyl-D-erythritol 2,4-cyclodiphosphate synthase [Spiroplasma diminutum CUAS-1]
MQYRVGFSKDTHNLIDGHNIKLGGIEIPSNKSVEAYSDGDILYHSLAEALFGSLGLEDLGQNYNSKNMTEGFDSFIIIFDALNHLNKKNYKISNVDILIELDSPKLGQYKNEIKQKLAKELTISLDQISVKATTTEGNFENIITCYCNLIIYKSEEK